ncbi:hypothetical protein ACQ858_08275 [Variovorax ureilyticus]|uniref:hypothetical protein n=1 Tax=Variovorax ureilyticus TaxID=1836198 RepID=UPI003D6709EE
MPSTTTVMVNAATYHVTTPAQLELARRDRARAEAAFVRNVEQTARRLREIGRAMGIRLPAQQPRSRA